MPYIRLTSGGTGEVSTSIARHMVNNGHAVVIDKPAEPKAIDQMTIDELKAHAAENSIDLGEAKLKREIVAAIEEAGDDSAGSTDPA